MSMSVYKPTAERQNVIDVHVCAAFLCLKSAALLCQEELHASG